jgi:hypothetical protein
VEVIPDVLVAIGVIMVMIMVMIVVFTRHVIGIIKPPSNVALGVIELIFVP